MPEQWYRCSAGHEALRTALDDDRLVWLYVERMEDTQLSGLSEWLKGPIPLDHTRHGRAFGPALEIAWWQGPGGLAVRACVEGGEPPPGLPWQLDRQASQLSLQETERILLFGEHDQAKSGPTANPVWSSARTPRFLSYPVQGQPGRVALEVAVYALGGVLAEQRLLRVIGEHADAAGR